MSHTPYRRLLPSVYSDNDMGIKLSVQGGELPSARMVADRIVQRISLEPETDLSVHLMQWGQFLTHDLDHTPEIKPEKGKTWDCCGKDSEHIACAPIVISKDDSLYGLYNKTCMSFTRSSLAPSLDCKARR